VTRERAIGVERGPAAIAHVVALVGALPRELDARPAITIGVAAVEFSRHRDEAQFAETVLIELDKAGCCSRLLGADRCAADRLGRAVYAAAVRWKVVPTLFWMNAPGRRRAIAWVAFQPVQ
jgi:hypothetical protein